MTQQEQELQLIAYLLGDLEEDQVREVERKLAESEPLRKELEVLSSMLNGLDNMETEQPSEKVSEKFYAFLNEQGTQDEAPATLTGMARRRNLYRLSAAAVVLVLIGVFVGSRFAGTGNLLADNQLNETKDAMQVLLEESSTSERLEAVNASYVVEDADDEIIGILIKVLREDESTSVRLAALDALSQFIGTKDVSLELAQSLSYQETQVVQIALINMLVDLKETEAIPELEELIAKEEIDQNVKDQARLGLFKML